MDTLLTYIGPCHVEQFPCLFIAHNSRIDNVNLIEFGSLVFHYGD